MALNLSIVIYLFRIDLPIRISLWIQLYMILTNVVWLLMEQIIFTDPPSHILDIHARSIHKDEVWGVMVS